MYKRQIRGLALKSPHRLVNHHARIRKRKTLALGSGRQEKRPHGTGLPHAPVSYTHLDVYKRQGIDLHEILIRVLAPALWRYRCNRALDQFEQGLLYAFTGNVPGYRWVVRFA